MSDGPGSLLKTGGSRSLDRSLFSDTQLDPGDSDPFSSFSTRTLIFWSEVSLRGETVTLTVSSEQESGNQFVHQCETGLRGQDTSICVFLSVSYLLYWSIIYLCAADSIKGATELNIILNLTKHHLQINTHWWFTQFGCAVTFCYYFITLCVRVCPAVRAGWSISGITAACGQSLRRTENRK